MNNNEEIILSIVNSINLEKNLPRAKKELIVAKRLNDYLTFSSEKSAIQRMFDCIRIPAKITGIEFEESSNRYVIHFIAAGGFNSENEEETIRTDRTDGSRGSFVKEMLGDISTLVGKWVVIYKTTEEMKGRKGQTFRVAPYIHVFR